MSDHGKDVSHKAGKRRWDRQVPAFFCIKIGQLTAAEMRWKNDDLQFGGENVR